MVDSSQGAGAKAQGGNDNGLTPVLLSSEEERMECFKLRHDAYVAAGNIDARPNGIFKDQYDEAPGCALLGLRDQNDDLVGSIRLGIQIAGAPLSSPEFSVFTDFTDGLLSEGERVASGGRLCITSHHPNIKQILLSLLFLLGVSAHATGARWGIASGTGSYARIYERMLGMVPVSEHRKMPLLKKSQQLCVVDLKAKYPGVRAGWDRTSSRMFEKHEAEYLMRLNSILSDSIAPQSAQSHFGSAAFVPSGGHQPPRSITPKR